MFSPIDYYYIKLLVSGKKLEKVKLIRTLQSKNSFQEVSNGNCV